MAVEIHSLPLFSDEDKRGTFELTNDGMYSFVDCFFSNEFCRVQTNLENSLRAGNTGVWMPTEDSLIIKSTLGYLGYV